MWFNSLLAVLPDLECILCNLDCLLIVLVGIPSIIQKSSRKKILNKMDIINKSEYVLLKMMVYSQVDPNVVMFRNFQGYSCSLIICL